MHKLCCCLTAGASWVLASSFQCKVARFPPPPKKKQMEKCRVGGFLHFPTMGLPQTAFFVKIPLKMDDLEGTRILGKPPNCDSTIVPCIALNPYVWYGKCSRIGARWVSNWDPSWPTGSIKINIERSWKPCSRRRT